MAEIRNDDEARAVAKILRDRKDLDPAVRENMTQALRSYAKSQDSKQERFVHPKAAAAATTVGGMVQGVQDLAFNTAEYGLLLADALVRDDDDPMLQAAVNRAQTGLRNTRQALERKEQEMLDAAIGEGHQFSGMGKVIGEFIATLPLASARFLQGSTWTRTAVSNMAVGGVLGGIGAAENAEALSETVGGMTLGAVMGLGASALYAPSGVKAYIGRQYNRAMQSETGKQAAKLEDDIRRITGDNEFGFTIGQITRNPYVTGLEMGARGERALAQQNTNLQALSNFIERRASALSPDKVATDLHNTMVTASRQMHKIARRNYGLQIDSILKQHGDELIMTGPGAVRYVHALREVIGELGDVRGISSSVPQGLLRHHRWIEERVFPFIARRVDGEWRLIERSTGKQVQSFGDDSAAALKAAEAENRLKGGLTAEDVHEVVKQHNAVMNGERNIFDSGEAGSLDHVARFLKGEMLSSLRGSSSRAVTSLERARKSYATDLEHIRTMEQSHLGRLFGKDLETVLADPDALLDNLVGRTPEGLKSTVNILRQHNPALLDDVKSAAMRRVVQASRRPDMPDSFVETDLTALANALSGPGKASSAGWFGKGLFTPGEQQELISVGKALRKLNNTYVDRISKDAAGIAADTSINIISRYGAFMARYVTRLLAKGSTVEALLVDPKARRSLIDLAEKGPDSATGKAAIAYLGYALGQQQEAERVADENERRQRMAVDDPRN